MTTKKYTIRNMTEEEVINISVEWAAIEGWNSGIHAAVSLAESHGMQKVLKLPGCTQNPNLMLI